MEFQHILVLKTAIVLPNGSITKHIGPFSTAEEVDVWYNENQARYDLDNQDVQMCVISR